MWTFVLPALRERPEDIEPNIEYELERHARLTSSAVRIQPRKRERCTCALRRRPQRSGPGTSVSYPLRWSRMATLQRRRPHCRGRCARGDRAPARRMGAPARDETLSAVLTRRSANHSGPVRPFATSGRDRSLPPIDFSGRRRSEAVRCHSTEAQHRE